MHPKAMQVGVELRENHRVRNPNRLLSKLMIWGGGILTAGGVVSGFFLINQEDATYHYEDSEKIELHGEGLSHEGEAQVAAPLTEQDAQRIDLEVSNDTTAAFLAGMGTVLGGTIAAGGIFIAVKGARSEG